MCTIHLVGIVEHVSRRKRPAAEWLPAFFSRGFAARCGRGPEVRQSTAGASTELAPAVRQQLPGLILALLAVR